MLLWRTRIVLGTIAAVMAAVVVEIQHSPPNSVRVMKILCYKRHLLYVLLCTDWQCIARHWESVYQLSQSIKINHDTVPPSALSPLSLPLETTKHTCTFNLRLQRELAVPHRGRVKGENTLRCEGDQKRDNIIVREMLKVYSL